jgi:hypothetical protein
MSNRTVLSQVLAFASDILASALRRGQQAFIGDVQSVVQAFYRLHT